ncbi:MAG: nucleotidyltransferase domain-containing protein [Synergistaceae bacterium]|nr:nucleotidyltransferase domain-containing protein [Synergistaceae bacterium]
MSVKFPERKTLDDKEMFDDVVRAILSVMGDDAVKIILYGSVARGDNTWESDVDIAVLTAGKYSDVEDVERERKKLWEAVDPLNLKYGTLFSVITIDAKHYEEWLFDLPFYYNIDEEGIILWTRENGRICLNTALSAQKKNLTLQNSY